MQPNKKVHTHRHEAHELVDHSQPWEKRASTPSQKDEKRLTSHVRHQKRIRHRRPHQRSTRSLFAPAPPPLLRIRTCRRSQGKLEEGGAYSARQSQGGKRGTEFMQDPPAPLSTNKRSRMAQKPWGNLTTLDLATRKYTHSGYQILGSPTTPAPERPFVLV
jgi:hypothetical protein